MPASEVPFCYLGSSDRIHTRPKPLIRNFSGSAFPRKDFREINDGLQKRLKWSADVLGLHPLPSI